MNNEDIRVLGYCTECGAEITDKGEEYFCNEDGEYFCDVECVLEHYAVHRLET